MDGLMDDDHSIGNDESLGITATTGATGLDTMKTYVVIDPKSSTRMDRLNIISGGVGQCSVRVH